MKKSPFLLLIIFTFIVELVLCFFIIRGIRDEGQDTVLVNECVKSVEENFGNPEGYRTSLAYTVIDTTGVVLFQSTAGAQVSAEELSQSVNEAIHNNDTILDLVVDGEIAGKILIHNPTSQRTESAKKDLMRVLIIFSALQMMLIIAYFIYLNQTILKPFARMNDFAIRIAGGNLDVPLEVDKGHVFGSFTEAFDLMRSELKKAQIAEKKANDEKKETIAKLSHDIKTPVASIKSSSEIGYEFAKDEKSREYFHLINEKADQITTLTDNLFNSSVQDATQIAVNPVRQPSTVVEKLLRTADYRGKAVAFAGNRAGEPETDTRRGKDGPESVYAVPVCEVMIDKLRLQQVFDNLFMNSYKYADTDIKLSTSLSGDYLLIEIRDFGPGVKQEELPLLKEKYKRGSNSSDKDGAGLGLYLTEYFLTEMGGKLEISNAGNTDIAQDGANATAGAAGFVARVFLHVV